ncbi:MAG: DNA-3-methyladenine glycosylase [Alkalibacterium sp.]|nr:DNA-3-methyladenine glycosylase [Alkalibacterium sp.]
MSFLKDPTLTTEQVAKELLGCLLVKEDEIGITSGWIVETEAYVGVQDEACHSYNGKRTPRLESMYKKAGTLYVYQMHTHHMVNIVTRTSDEPQAVLIRAIEPYEGVSIFEEHRKRKGIELTNGPGKLTKAMGITMEDNGTESDKYPLYIASQKKRVPNLIQKSKRIGIPNKGHWTDALLRYSVEGNPYVSRRKGKPMNDHGWEAMIH